MSNIGPHLDLVMQLNAKNYRGPFNNYVEKMRGEGVKKCLFVSTLRVSKLSTQGPTGGVKKWQIPST